MNVHQEICAISRFGGILVDSDQILRCVQIAEVKAIEVTNLIRNIVVRFL